MRITVTRAAHERDWRVARALLGEHLSWVAQAVGVDVRTRQPSSTAELADPATFYRRPHGALVLARAGDRPAGIVGVHRLAGPVGELKRMYVRPWARGLGLGHALVAEAVAASRDLGLAELRLQTEPASMAAAVHVYRSAGFADITPYGDLGIEGVVTLGLVLAPSPAVR